MKITITIDIEEKKIDTEKENIKKELRELLMEAEKKALNTEPFCNKELLELAPELAKAISSLL